MYHTSSSFSVDLASKSWKPQADWAQLPSTAIETPSVSVNTCVTAKTKRWQHWEAWALRRAFVWLNICKVWENLWCLPRDLSKTSSDKELFQEKWQNTRTLDIGAAYALHVLPGQWHSCISSLPLPGRLLRERTVPGGHHWLWLSDEYHQLCMFLVHA